MITNILEDRLAERTALSCVWIETGNPARPLACVWVDRDLRMVADHECPKPELHPLCA